MGLIKNMVNEANSRPCKFKFEWIIQISVEKNVFYFKFEWTPQKLVEKGTENCLSDVNSIYWDVSYSKGTFDFIWI